LASPDLLDLLAVPIGMRREKQDPLVAVDQTGEGVRGEPVPQRLGSRAHKIQVGSSSLIKHSDRLFPRGKTALRAEPFGRLVLSGAIAKDFSDLIVFVADLRAFVGGRLDRDRAGQKLRNRNFRRSDVLGALGDRPTVGSGPRAPLLFRESLEPGEQSSARR